MKQILNARAISILSIFIILVLISCEKTPEDTTPPPGFYEQSTTTGDGFVTISYTFLDFENSKYGVEVTYYQDGVKKVQNSFGACSITMNGLKNNETYTFTVVTYDEAGNRSSGFNITAIPNTPFTLVFPKEANDYILEDGKLRIDLRFNRSADTDYPNSPFIDEVVRLTLQDEPIPYTYSWHEDNQVFSLITTEKVETFCQVFPCNVSLDIWTLWVGGTVYDCFKDTNGMLLDGDGDGKEMGDAEFDFVIE